MNRLPSATLTLGVMAWLFLPGASTVLSIVHADDALVGHRLFFTEAQRNESVHRAEEVSHEHLPEDSIQGAVSADAGDETTTQTHSDENVKARSSNPADTRQRRNPKASRKHAEKVVSVYFTGLVTGMREARVLVNGLPCEPASAEHGETPARPMPINCHGVQSAGLTLTLSLDTGELLVVEPGGRVHRLRPGEGV